VLNGALIIIASAMLVAAIITWVLMPLGKFVHYLATNPELSRVRTRAVLTTILFFGALIGGFGFIPAPDHSRAQGVVEPLIYQEVPMEAEGGIVTMNLAAFPTSSQSYGMPMVKKGDLLVSAESIMLKEQIEQLKIEYEILKIQRDMAFVGDPNKGSGPPEAAKKHGEAILKLGLLKSKELRLEYLKTKAPVTGVFVHDDLPSRNGMYINPGDKLGVVASLDIGHLMIRAWVPNELAGTMHREAKDRVEIRVMGRPDILLEGHIRSKAQSGQNKLPSAALGYAAGGATETTNDDKEGKTTTERGLEVRIDRLKYLAKPPDVNDLLSGQRVIVRFEFESKPYLAQAWTSLRQLFQKKF
jgi:putative peptide zinc metalloprotease protein